MKYKLTAAFLHAVALACLAAGCGLGPRQAASVGPDAAPAPTTAQAPSSSPGERPSLCADGVQSPLPPPAGYVNDYARVLDAEAGQRLEEKLARLKERANIEAAVVTVETTGGRDIFQYSLDVACGWGVGTRGDGGGLLLLVATQDRRWHVQVSRQLEADLPDAEVAHIGGRMRPHLASGDYARGLEACVDGLIARLAEKRDFPP